VNGTIERQAHDGPYAVAEAAQGLLLPLQAEAKPSPLIEANRGNARATGLSWPG